MHRKPLCANPILVALALLLPGILLPLTFLPVSGASPGSSEASVFSVQSHELTPEEAVQMELAMGVYVEGENYNVIVDGHGTGLAPPTASQWTEMVGSVQVTDVVQTALMAPASYDLSSQPYFPAVGNQGSQGSCAAWAMAYYDYGYLEARDNNWTDASTGNTAHLMSPAWTYNRANSGVDRGTFMDNIADVIRDWGVATLKTMPYVATDITSWGSQDAFREAPLHRAVGVSYISYSSSNPTLAINNIKNLISTNVPVTFALDANMFAGTLADNIIAADEYTSASMNHAQTIVGYDDTRTDGVHPDVGAFKVVNSWGKAWGNEGYYWITYEAMKKIGSNLFLTYITDQPSYQPSLLAIIQFNNAPTRESAITLGVGTVGGTDTFSPYFENNYDSSVTAAFPTFMAIDVTDLLPKYQSGKTSFYLTLGTTMTAGNVSSFRIEQYQNGFDNPATQVSGQSSDVPKINPGSVTVILTPYATITPATALDNGGLTLTGSGNALWSPETRDSHSGGSAMQSGNVGNAGKSVIQTTALGPSTVSFWWKTSTQTTDRVRFYVDTVNMANASGATAWTQVSMDITSGSHVLKWEYTKDAATSGNQDLVLLDLVQATSGTTVPTAPTGLTATVDSTIQLNWSSPSSNGGSALTSYRIYRGTSAGTGSFLTSVPASWNVFTDTNLTANRTYYYQVTATSSVGESDRSNEAIGKMPMAVPATPTSMTATAGASFIDLSWTSNGANLTGFHLYRGTAADGESLFQTLGSAVRSFRDSTATAGTMFYYRVDAFNAQVSSSYSNEASARIPAVPNAPTSLVATDTGSTVHLAWTAPLDDGGSMILGYRVYRGTTADGESASPLGTVGSLAYDDLTATAGTRYYYVVKANNPVGESAPSNEASILIVHAPDAPSSLAAGTSPGHVSLTWTAPASNGGSQIISYKVFRGAAADQSTHVLIGTVTTRSYDDAQTTVGQTCYYSVKAVNILGDSVASNVVSVKVKGLPGAPNTPTIQISDRSLILAWSAPISDGYSPIIAYRIYRSEGSSGEAYFATVSGTTYIDLNLVNGYVYYYRVSALNAMGEGPKSAEVHDSPAVPAAPAATLPDAPSSVTGNVSKSSILVSWAPPAFDGGIGLSGFSVYRSNEDGWTLLYTINDPGTLSYLDQTAVGGIAYRYGVAAINTFGEGPRSTSSASVLTSSAPSAFNLTAMVGESNVTLSWTIPASNGTPLLRFTIVRTETENGAVSTTTLASTDTRYIDGTVVPGHDYSYTVAATNAVGSTSANLLSVHALRTVVLNVQIVPFSRTISVSGTVTDVSGQGIGDQTVTIYRSSDLTGPWTEIIQLTTYSDGKYSTLLSSSVGILRLRTVLADDGTHGPMVIDRTVGSLRLKNGDLVNIETGSTMSNTTLSGMEGTITFSLEQAGTANISIPKGAIVDPGLIRISIDGIQWNYQLSETEEQYVFSLCNVNAGQMIAMSIGNPTTQDTVPILIWISLLMVACIGTTVLWSVRRK